MHNYPKGALTCEEDLLFHLLGQPLYLVHGLGESSFLTEMVNVRNLYTYNEKSRIFEYDNEVHGYSSEHHLADCNIGAHHNDHYLFRHKEDALNYLAYAKKHTPSIRRRGAPIHILVDSTIIV